MSDIVSLEARKSEPRLRIGILRLTDSAPVIASQFIRFLSLVRLDL